MPGYSKKVYEEICDAEIFVLSSNYEGMPNALLEAMCLGLPVISTKVSGASDIIKDGENGYLVEPNDINGMVNAIDKLVSDEKKREAFAKEASKLSKITDSHIISLQWKKYIDGVRAKREDGNE